jgi:nitrite reductase/ring-hydroxylating ferredoxin subunit
MTVEHPSHQLTRRRALTGAAAAGVGQPLVAPSGGGNGQTATDQAPAGGKSPDKGSAPQPLAKTSDIPVGGGVIFASANVVVTQPTGGTFKGFSATCTHMGCQVAKVADNTIQCPCHGSQFSITDGAVVQGPAPSPLPPVQLKVAKGEITQA